jgi:hypothetical protein
MLTMKQTESLFEVPDPAPVTVVPNTPHLHPKVSPAKALPRLSRSKKTKHFEINTLFAESPSPPVSKEIEGSSSAKTFPPQEALFSKKHRLHRDFSMSDPSALDAPEYYRIRRKSPYPPVLDDLIISLMESIPLPSRHSALVEGAIFPSALIPLSSKIDKIVYRQEDPTARSIAKKLVTDCCEISTSVAKKNQSKFSLVVCCFDDCMGKVLVEKILSASSCLEPSSPLVVVTPSDYLLDYTTNVRNEAPLLRDSLHKKYRTHFILRPTGPLMEPSWDILVLTLRTPGTPIPKNKWRLTGTGFLPWQKCNEAISTSPWLLVESVEQAPQAIARCIHYPWEIF